MSTNKRTSSTKATRKAATTKRVVKAAANATAANDTTSAAAIIRKHFAHITNMKTARALLRAHHVDRSEKSIVAFFKARSKQRVS